MFEPVWIMIYAMVCGFVAAGLLNELHLILQKEDAENNKGRGLVMRFDSPVAVTWSMFICVFAGPYLVLSQGLRFWRMRILPGSALALCSLVSVVWSFCSGVFIVEAMFALGLAG